MTAEPAAGRRLPRTSMNFAAELLATGAPDAPALVHGQVRVTFDELRRRAHAVAARLATEGVRPGDAVGLLAENSPFFATAYLGTLLAGAIAVPLNTDLGPADLLEALGEAGARLLLATERQARRFAAAAISVPVPVCTEATLDTAPAAREPHPAEAPHGVAALMFTSGSTGKPRAVVISHRNLQCNTGDIVRYLGLTPADRALLVLPLHYCYGLSVLLSHLAAGASVVFNNQFLYPQTVVDDLARHDCTGFAGVPSTYQILLRKSKLRQAALPALRWLQQAGGKLPNPFIREILDTFPAVRFYTMYGQTEATARLSYLPPELLPQKLGSIGRGLPSTRLHLLRSDGSEIPPGSEEVGEIVASGDNIAAGYWKDPAETARYFRGGRLHTGDLARRDADGDFFIVERERDMIKAGGNRVSAKAVEDVICEVPEVVEAAVVAMPHDLLGEAIAAFVTLTAGATVGEAALRDHCRRRLPAYQVPELVRIVPRLPHNASGKVLKAELRQSLSAPQPMIPS